MIGESSDWWTLKTYLAENTKNVEVLIGVILPILMLIGFEWKKRGVDAGASRVLNHRAKTHQESSDENATSHFDPFPARMVMFSLLVIGCWMLILGFLSVDGCLILLSFGGSLLIMSGAIHFLIRKWQS